MKERNKVSKRHMRTEHLDIDISKCIACKKCIEVCENQVLKVVGFKFLFFEHRHIKIVHPEECIGCLLCLKACDENAIAKNK